MKKVHFTKFNNQRQNAYKRNIGWHFTYEEWENWWGNDIELRGKGKGKLCMARIGDSGDYHPNNVFKLLFEENISQAQKGRPSEKKGVPHSLERKLKNSQAQKAFYAMRRLEKEIV
ncbi:hypothetical protein UFOVP180_11 [uncultured Caudovirales phage]|uniref:Uncharacterized protein n=1 Tax=uncultured Caudovirales phage TaxID=2100421 RepID=A0A6J7WJP7_9CAUD|nr:hypothetical protein UFOVP180_11 [uncultured Caudovirales phage]